ncbi:MAG: ribosomal protein S18-alanine N-acetyltransferase [Rhodobacter sp.]|nr:ribosomal protein S18-alanine N-acetyltransferase [Rhodobacter sp.]
MTPEALAELHARCFTVPRPFSTGEFRDLLAAETCFLITCPQGFALGRATVDEAELLTLAVDPGHRRQGIGRALLADFEAEARRRGARRAYLEVAAGNAAARRLYAAAGYRDAGRRKAYYRDAGRQAEDAIVLDKPLITA